MSTGFIKRPLDVVHVGMIVKVWVLDVDLNKGRLQLTMIDPNAPLPKRVERGQKKDFKNNRKPLDFKHPQKNDSSINNIFNINSANEHK